MAKKKINLELSKKLGNLILFSMKNKDKNQVVKIGKSSPSLIKQAVNFDVDLKDHVIYVDSSAIRHSFNRHGLNSKNVKNGAIPILPFDVIYLPIVLQTGKVINCTDSIITIQKTNIGVIGEIICEIRISKRKGKRIFLKTMYNIKRKRS